MGCSSSSVDADDFNTIESLLTQKKNILSETREKNEVNDDQKVKMVRIDIDISEKLEDLNTKIKEEGGGNEEIKNKYDNIMKEYQSLVKQWKQFLKEDIEEEEIIQGKIAKDWGTNYNNNYDQFDDENDINNIETNKKNDQRKNIKNNTNNSNNVNNKPEYPYINDDES